MRPVVLYDGGCGFCRWIVKRFGWVVRRRGALFASVRQPWVGPTFGIPPDRLLDEFRVVDVGGRVHGGGAALAELGRLVRPWRALWVVGRLRVGRDALDRGYHWVSRRRDGIARVLGIG